MSKHTLKVRKVAGAPAVEFTVNKPASVEDPAWLSMVKNGQIDINELAFQSWVIKAQAAYRNAGVEPGEYVYGEKVSRTPAVVMDFTTFSWPKDKALAKEQYESLCRSGVVFINVPENLPF